MPVALPLIFWQLCCWQQRCPLLSLLVDSMCLRAEASLSYNQSKWVAFFQLCNSLLWTWMIWVFIRFNSCICWMLKMTFSLSHLTHLCSDCLGVRIKAVNTINAFEENLKASNNEPILRTLVFYPIQKFVSAFTRIPLKHQTNPSMMQSTESVPFMNTSHCTDFKVVLKALRPIVNQYQQYNYCI